MVVGRGGGGNGQLAHRQVGRHVELVELLVRMVGRVGLERAPATQSVLEAFVERSQRAAAGRGVQVAGDDNRQATRDQPLLHDREGAATAGVANAVPAAAASSAAGTASLFLSTKSSLGEVFRDRRGPRADEPAGM